MWRTRPTEAPGPATRSIAVVPIRNLTGDPAKAFLADGLTEVLIANLARVRALRVPSFGAVASLRGKDEQPADVAKKLGVQLLLAGSITQADSKFRMSVQLIDPKSGQALWGEELVREVPGMIPAQAEVARLVAERLSLTLSADEQRALGARVIDPRAQEVYLRGLALRTTLPTARDDAARLFREATEVDPLFADAWAQLALVEVALANASANADPLTRSRGDRNDPVLRRVELCRCGTDVPNRAADRSERRVRAAAILDAARRARPARRSHYDGAGSGARRASRPDTAHLARRHSVLRSRFCRGGSSGTASARHLP